jgi:hypothetical protein
MSSLRRLVGDLRLGPSVDAPGAVDNAVTVKFPPLQVYL